VAQALNNSEVYRGFVIAWQEPPRTSAAWTANVASDDPSLNALMRIHGSMVIDGPTREEMIARSKAFIDSLLS